MPDGSVAHGGTFSQSTTGFGHERIAAPHLQRFSPSGDRLASLDAVGRRLHVRVVNPDGLARHALTRDLGGLSGTVHTFRWLTDHSSVAIHTSTGLFLLRGTAQGHVRAIPLLEDAVGRTVQDFRMLRGGLVAKAGNEAFFIRTDDLVIHRLVPRARIVTAVSTLSRGRIVVAVRGVGPAGTDELWTFDAAAGDAPGVVAQRPCPRGCDIRNWTPGTDTITYARADGTIVHELPTVGGPVRTTELRMDPRSRHLPIHALWRSDDGRQLLAATRYSARVWDRDGRVLWTWHSGGVEELRSAHFDADGSVVATLSRRVVRLAEGKLAATLVSVEIAERDLGLSDDSDAFLEDAQPIPGGGVAVSVVTHERRLGVERGVGLGARSALPRLIDLVE